MGKNVIGVYQKVKMGPVFINEYEHKELAKPSLVKCNDCARKDYTVDRALEVDDIVTVKPSASNAKGTFRIIKKYRDYPFPGSCLISLAPYPVHPSAIIPEFNLFEYELTFVCSLKSKLGPRTRRKSV